MVILHHFIRIGDAGFTCTCGYAADLGKEKSEYDRRVAAAKHQFGAFLNDEIGADAIETSCLACGVRIRVAMDGENRFDSYQRFAYSPCEKCGIRPIDAVSRSPVTAAAAGMRGERR